MYVSGECEFEFERKAGARGAGEGEVKGEGDSMRVKVGGIIHRRNHNKGNECVRPDMASVVFAGVAFVRALILNL